MTEKSYYSPKGGLPGQSDLMTGRAVFTQSYAVIPKGVMSDIVTSNLPNWAGTRAWILARPMTGFAETFAQYIVEVTPGGGSEKPEPDQAAEAVLFLLSGELTLTINGDAHSVTKGGYAFIPAGVMWRVKNNAADPCSFVWVRKIYQAAEGIDPPDIVVTNENDKTPDPMPDTNGAWTTTRFLDPDDMRYDICVNVVTFQPGGVIPFEETHVMEHGIYVLEGKAVYKLNRDWVEVEAGDFIWLRAFCPQACYAGGPGPFRYLLYKDVNRHPDLSLK